MRSVADFHSFGDHQQPPIPSAWAPPPAPPPIGMPPGYVPYTSPVVHPPSALRKWTIGLMWAQVAGGATLAVAQIAYAGVINDYVDGTRSYDDVDSKERAVVVLLLVFFAIAIAGLIVLSIWSLRTVRNARARDRWTQLSPGMACGGWYIPIGAYWLPWQQLRRATRRFGGRTSALNWWQGLWIASTARVSFSGTFGGADGADIDRTVANALQVGAVISVITTILAVAGAVAATVATRDVDAATSGTAPPNT